MEQQTVYQRYWEYIRRWMANQKKPPTTTTPSQPTTPTAPTQPQPQTPTQPTTPKPPAQPTIPTENKEKNMTKKALVVGIDKYKNPAWNLQGCSMDAAVMSGMLQDHFGFPGDNVRLLLDDRATKANMLSRLDWLVRDAKPGDVLAFFYAGHGSQVRDRNGDELDDHLDEILCPHDLNWDDPLSDDVLSQYFSRVPEGVNLTVIFDCCNSGTATRSLYLPVGADGKMGEPEYKKSRFISPPLDIEHRSRGIVLPTLKVGEVIMKNNHILMTACQSNQEAQEKSIEGQIRGAFSYYLQAVLKRANWMITYREAHLAAMTRLKDNGYVQVPQLEAPAAYMEKTLFGSFAA